MPLDAPAYPNATLYPGSDLFPGDGGEVAPTVVTNPVTGITTTSATFSGTVTPGSGLTSHYYWEYDGSQTPERVAGTATASVSETVSGLPPGHRYDVRLVAFNTAGFGYGNYVEFRTTALPVSEYLSDYIHTAGRGQ